MLERPIPAQRGESAPLTARLDDLYEAHVSWLEPHLLAQLKASIERGKARLSEPPEPMTRAKAEECLDLLAHFGIHPTDRNTALEGMLA